MIVCFDLSGPFSAARLVRVKKRIGVVLLSQTHDRIDQSGDDEYKFPALDYPRVTGSTDSPLKDTGTHLDASLSYGMDAKEVWVGSKFIGARVQQQGMKAKGGLLNPIRPVKAKALFIPLSRKGLLSTKNDRTGLREYYAKGGKGMRSSKASDALVAKARARGLNVRRVRDLKRGYLPPRPPKYNKGADFALLQKVNIRPRKFLRMSPKNRQEIISVIAGS